jgi:hypothetical protein
MEHVTSKLPSLPFPYSSPPFLRLPENFLLSKSWATVVKAPNVASRQKPTRDTRKFYQIAPRQRIFVLEPSENSSRRKTIPTSPHHQRQNNHQNRTNINHFLLKFLHK